MYRFCIKTLVGHREWVRMVRVYEDSTLLASSSVDHVSHVSCYLRYSSSIVCLDHKNMVTAKR